MKHIGGKGPKIFHENKGSWLQLAAGERARLGLGQLNRKEKGVISTKAPITQPATIIPLAIFRLHCKP